MDVAEIKRRASQDAARILQEHWVDSSGECPLPVDATIIAERMGAEVFLADLSSMNKADLSGYIYKEPGKNPIIAVNSTDHLNRRRFTCAHEIGHMVDNEGKPEIGYVDNRDTLSSSGTDEREIYANSFAAALLMPSDEVEWLSENLDAYALARRFQVSVESMSYRLDSLGIRHG